MENLRAVQLLESVEKRLTYVEDFPLTCTACPRARFYPNNHYL